MSYILTEDSEIHVHACLMQSKILKNAENARKSKEILGTARRRVKAPYMLESYPEHIPKVHRLPS